MDMNNNYNIFQHEVKNSKCGARELTFRLRSLHVSKQMHT